MSAGLFDAGLMCRETPAGDRIKGPSVSQVKPLRSNDWVRICTERKCGAFQSVARLTHRIGLHEKACRVDSAPMPVPVSLELVVGLQTATRYCVQETGFLIPSHSVDRLLAGVHARLLCGDRGSSSSELTRIRGSRCL